MEPENIEQMLDALIDQVKARFPRDGQDAS
jgi:hypothetical protein